MGPVSEHEVLTSLSDTILELHAAEEALYLLMRKGGRRLGELVAQVTFMRTKEQRLRDLLSVLRQASSSDPARCDVCDGGETGAAGPSWPRAPRPIGCAC